MKTRDFFDSIVAYSDKRLRFRDHRDMLVHPSFHVSEVKVGSFQTIDCGEMAHEWDETILQLWLSDDPDSEKAMGIGKVIGILKKVSQKIAINPESELRIEYGNEEFPVVQFTVGVITVEKDEVIVTLVAPVASCKLLERGGSCFRPAPSESGRTAGCDSGQSSCCS